MALLKYKTDEGWKILYGGLLSKILRKDKNLSDLGDIVEAKENLGLIGDVSDPQLYSEEETHNHDSRYPLKSELQAFTDSISDIIAEQLERFVQKAGDTMTGALNLANNLWNKVGKDANIGSKNIAGKVCIQGQNGETGLAMYQTNSETNYGTLAYNGTAFYFDKPVNISGNTKITGTLTVTEDAVIQGNGTVNGKFKITGGFDPDKVNTPQLNAYSQKVNFIYGEHPARTNNHLTPFFGNNDSGIDYGGIVFGCPLDAAASTAGGGLVQLISNCSTDSKLLYRQRDGSSTNWSPWKEIATLDDVSQAKSVTTQSVATNGYIKFSNGLILQWGKQLVNNDASTTINFSQPYSSAAYMVVANPQRQFGSGAGGSYTHHALNSEITNTGFSIKAKIEGHNGQIYINWISIGE